MIAQRRLIAAVTIFALAAAAPVVAAEPAAEQQSLTVKYADLDLTREAGVSLLTARIKHAANAACGPVDFRSLREVGLFNACRDEAIKSAMAKVETAVAAARRSLYAASGEARNTN
ncbi:MAG TPA: UrcA family protein [Alphaproteobacteria bacterium]|nr:UrcA family protein [Alphaproteobacteria bacterium]